MAVQARVLTCNRCIFRCKLFNKSNIKFCMQDFHNKCLRREGGVLKCFFVHKQDLGHLDLPKLCQTFALRNFCPNRDKEKDLAHMSYQQYDASVKAAIKATKGDCAKCQKELEENIAVFEKTIRNKAPQKPVNIENVMEENRSETNEGKKKQTENGGPSSGTIPPTEIIANDFDMKDISGDDKNSAIRLNSGSEKKNETTKDKSAVEDPINIETTKDEIN